MPQTSDPIRQQVKARGGKRFRMTSPRWGLRSENVDRDKGVISGSAVITRGEALGHEMWVDETFLDQVVAAGRSAGRGVKARFTHPGLCSDGLGKYMGRWRDFRRAGDVVRADLHLSPVTDKSPEFNADPAEYLMDLAEKDPEAFGNSIVFWHDIGEEDRFIAENEDEDGHFVSPDPDNVHHYYHCRLAKLDACDVVDEPAANPAGFFARGEEAAARAEQALAWLTGVERSTAPGPETLGNIEPERVKAFFEDFLRRHDLRVVTVEHPKEIPMTEAELKAKQEEAAKLAREQEIARLKALKDAFPGDEPFAVSAFERNLDVLAARAEYAGKLAESLKARDQEIAALKAEVEKFKAENEGLKKQVLAGPGPLEHGKEAQAHGSVSVDAALAYQTEHKCSFADAYRAILAAAEKK